MDQPTFFPAGYSEATRWACRYLAKEGFHIADHPNSEATHLLLPVPSFGADGRIKGGGILEHILTDLPGNITVIGGLQLDEPGADLPVALAVASSYRDAVIADDLVAIGEVGLTGEIRSVSNMNQRLSEVARLGFKKCIIPKNGSEKLEIPEGLTVYRVRNLREAIETAM